MEKTQELEGNLEGSSKPESSTTFQYFAAFSAALSVMCTSSAIGWPSQIIEELLDGKIGYNINSDELGWVTSSCSLGAALLSIFIGGVCEKFGRKKVMLLLVILMEIGWILVIFSQNVIVLIAGRFVTGMVGGAFCVIVPLYIHEISEIKIRGSLGCFTQLMFSVGILFANIVGYFLSIKNFSIACAVLPIIFSICFFFMPETPIYLLKIGKIDEACSSLKSLRRRDDVKEEMDELQRVVDLDNHLNVMDSIKSVVHNKAVRKASVIALVITLLKVGCGVDAITSYLSLIFSTTKTLVGPNMGSIIFAVVQVVSGCCQLLIIDNWGRKILLILSEVVLCLSALLCALCFFLKKEVLQNDIIAVDYIPLFALSLLIMAFSLGIGPIGWIITAEIFPSEIKGRAMSVCTFLLWFLAFVNVKIFSVLTDHIYYSFFGYCAISFAGVIFVAIAVPETKNKTYEQIRADLGRY